MVNLLGIGLDYLMLQNNKVRGDVRIRQLDYARLLDSFDLVVYSPRKANLYPVQFAENFKVIPTNSKSKSSFVLDAWRIASDICRRKKIDVLTVEDPFSTGLAGYLLSKRFKIPLNVQVHIDFCDNKYWLQLRKVNYLFNTLAKFILRRADTIRVGTEPEKKKLTELGIKEDRIYVIPVNSDLEKFKNSDGLLIRKQYVDGKFDRMLLFTGRLTRQKDIPTLLKAFKLILAERSSTLLVIVGSGDQENFLKKLVRDLEIERNVVFTGSLEHEEIPRYLSACDVYVVPSIYEGTCIAMVEAMAAGKPVVATRFAGAEYLIKDEENGFLVNQKDYKRMAERILEILNDTSKGKLMGEESAKRIENIFSGNRNIKAIIKLWELTANLKNEQSEKN